VAVLGVTIAPLLPEEALALPASKGQAADVGSYLPKAGIDDFVEFTATKDMTPVSGAACICLHSKPPTRFQ
jgi:hypothetical protein